MARSMIRRPIAATEKPKEEKPKTTPSVRAAVPAPTRNPVIANIAAESKAPAQKFEAIPEPSFKKVLSTGSTLLDLAISGLRVKGGGLPGGIMVEIYGPSGAGKTAIMAETCGSAQAHGGNINFNDPEGRLDQEYSEIYGVNIDEIFYTQPDTVVEAFNELNKFLKGNIREKEMDPINVCATDSIAALTTALEMSDDRDKMGMKKAKDLSQETRRSARLIAQSGNVVMFSNQVREGQEGQEVTPGGKAIGYFASLRMRIRMVKKIERTMKIALSQEAEKEDAPAAEETTRTKLARGMKKEKTEKGSPKEITKVLGIMSEVEITKSSVDHPHRKALILVRFGYGIDDIGANLQYLKDMKNGSMYVIPDGKSYIGLEQATLAVEEKGLAQELKQEVIELWEKVENAFQSPRKPKQR